jgi:hypothetical protein
MVKAESRRLMLQQVSAAAGASPTRTFAVNIRTPDLGDGKKVKLERPRGREPNLGRPALARIPRPHRRRAQRRGHARAAHDDHALHRRRLDRHRSDQTSRGPAGDRCCRDSSTRTSPSPTTPSPAARSAVFRSERRLDKILSTIKKGDWLFIQFGHNDMKEKGDGIGAFTSYKTDLKKYIAAAREKGAQPVVLTSMHRRRFDDNGKIVNTFGDYIEAARQAAAEEKVR